MHFSLTIRHLVAPILLIFQAALAHEVAGWRPVLKISARMPFTSVNPHNEQWARRPEKPGWRQDSLTGGTTRRL